MASCSEALRKEFSFYLDKLSGSHPDRAAGFSDSRVKVDVVQHRLNCFDVLYW